MAANEKTGKAVSMVAARVLRSFPKLTETRRAELVVVVMTRAELLALQKVCRGPIYNTVCSVGDLQSIAASALTQVGDHEDRAKVLEHD